MTVASQTTRADYTGNGATTLFAVPFYFLTDTDLQVLRTDNTTSPATTVVLALGTDYTVSGAGNPSGGSVTLTVAPSSAMALAILRSVPYTQLTHYVPNDPFPAASHEQALDKLTMEVQQLAEAGGRALTLAPATPPGVSTQLPAPEANTLLGWNEDADALQNVDPGTLATIVAFGTANVELFNGNGSNKNFTLATNPGAIANLDVSIAGVTQRANVDFTWNGGTTLSFVTAPPTGTNNIQARYMRGLPQGFTDSAASTFIQAGAGAVIRMAQSKMRDVVHVADYGAVGDGVTDDAVPIQNALNTGRRVIFGAGKTYLSTGNQIPSNTHLVFERGATIKAANGINRAVLQNVNWQSSLWGGAPYGLDSNITIEGMTVDGNQANQAKLGSGVYANEPTTGLRLFGVTNLKLRGVTIFQARTYAIWMCSIFNLTVDDLRLDQFMGGTPDNQDGLHIQGPAKYLDIRNVRGTTNDDMVALNADDVPQGAAVTTGAITNAIIDGVYPDGSLNGIRLLSGTSRMDQIFVKNVIGSTRDVAVNQSPFGLGPGNVGTLTIENIDVRCSNHFQPTTSNYYSVISLEGVIDIVSVSNVKNSTPADNRPTILIPGTANIAICRIEGLDAGEAASSTLSGLKVISVLGRVGSLSINDVSYLRDSSLVQTGSLLSIGATGNTVTNLSCSNWTVKRFVTPISVSDGIVTSISLTNINDIQGLPSFSLLSLASATASQTAVSTYNCNTDVGRQLVARAGSSTFAPRTTVDNAGASGAMATIPANQSCPSGTYTLLNFSAVVFDRMSEFNSTNKSFTITQGPGVYLISCTVDLGVATNPTDIVLALYKGGVLYRTFPGSTRYPTNALVGGTLVVSVATGDVFDVRLFASAAGVIAGNGAPTSLSFERLK